MAQGHFDLQRFVSAQQNCYTRVINELSAGRKRSHWIWYIFPQITGLGFSSTTQFYALSCIEEAQAYLAHPVLEKHLRECFSLVLQHKGKPVSEIFGYPDYLKLHSSATLFDYVSENETLYREVLLAFYAGKSDVRTIELVSN